MKRLFLVRHGQTDFNATRRFQGQIDVPLNETGLQQAGSIAAYLAATESIDRIVASDLTRARQTAEAIGEASGVAVEFDPRLREITVGEWEGLSREDIAAQWPDLLEAWNAGVDMRPPGGESRKEAGRRVADAVLDHVAHAAADEVLVAVAHGAVIRGVAEIFLGLVDSPDALLGVLDNCDFAEFARAGDRWVLRRWGGSAPAGAVA